MSGDIVTVVSTCEWINAHHARSGRRQRAADDALAAPNAKDIETEHAVGQSVERNVSRELMHCRPATHQLGTPVRDAVPIRLPQLSILFGTAQGAPASRDEVIKGGRPSR